MKDSKIEAPTHAKVPHKAKGQKSRTHTLKNQSSKQKLAHQLHDAADLKRIYTLLKNSPLLKAYFSPK